MKKLRIELFDARLKLNFPDAMYAKPKVRRISFSYLFSFNVDGITKLQFELIRRASETF